MNYRLDTEHDPIQDDQNLRWLVKCLSSKCLMMLVTPQTVSFLGYNFEIGGEVILLLVLGTGTKTLSSVEQMWMADTAAVVHWHKN